MNSVFNISQYLSIERKNLLFIRKWFCLYINVGYIVPNISLFSEENVCMYAACIRIVVLQFPIRKPF